MDTIVEKPSNCCDYFSRLSGFPNLFGKYFWSLLSWLIKNVSHKQCKSNSLIFLVSRDRKIITVEVLKAKKQAGTNFVLLC